jgi:dissimilatory sulfite reductase (desulfoviridin) alpha/beta subunit
MIEKTFAEINFHSKRRKQLGSGFKEHHVFKVCLAGCANCCSQPQIKDFGLIAKALPEFNNKSCNFCGACCKACKELGLKIDRDTLIFDKEKCLGCGDCWRVCPNNAIKPTTVVWRLLLGGKLGRHPQLTQEITEVDEKEVLEHLRKSLKLVLEADNPKKRFADLLKEKSISKKGI